MRALKLICIITSVILLGLYGAFLFVVPYAIDINKFEPDIQKAVLDSSGFKINTENLKVSTGWNLSAGVKASRIDAFYPNNEKFVQLKNVEVKLSLLPLFMKKIQLDSICADSVIARMKVQSDGKFYIEQFLTKKEGEVQPQTELPLGLEFSDVMPLINVKKYSVSFVDMPTNKFYTLEGQNFKISDFVLTKKIKVEGIGEVIFDKQKQLTYNLAVFSKVLPDFTAQTPATTTQKTFNIINLFEALHKIDLNADLNADLKISGTPDDIRTDGTLDINGLTLKVKGKKLPKSFIKMKLAENKININSNINTSATENILVNGFFQYGKSQNIDMTVKSDKIMLSNLFDIISSFFPFMGIEDIHGITANGTLKANFNIKSDFKKINSSGFLNIDDANIYYNLFNIAVKNINADIDFSRNQVGIRKSSATINGAPISMTGAIDTNAFANLNLKADKLPVKGLLATCGMLNVLNENNIKSGLITINATLKGNLSKTKPQIDVLIENLNLYNKPSKLNLALNKALAKIHLDKNNKVSGNLTLNSLTAKSSDFGRISLPATALTFDDKDFYIKNSVMYFNNSKINFKGKISDYTAKKNSVNIEIYGLVLANDIKNLIPKEFRKDVTAKGKLPLIARVSGDLTKQNIEAQLLANNSNNVSVININSLAGKTSLLNLSMEMANNTLKINDLSLNSLSVNKGLDEDFKSNLRTASKVVVIKGNVTNLQAKNPTLNGITVNIPSTLTASIPMYKNSKIQLKGDLNLNGNSANPLITGQVSLPYVYIPTLKTMSKNLNVVLARGNIGVNCPTLVIDNSQMAFTSNIDSNFARGVKIKNVNLVAENLNLDSIINAMAGLPQNSVGQGTDLGVTLSGGKAKLNNFEMGGLTAHDITSNFVINNNTLKMSNIAGSAYGGKIAGSADYNLVFGNLNVNMQGRGLSAEPALRGFTGMKNLIQGNLDFDGTNIKLIAGTQEQMMQTLRGKTTFIVSDGQMGTLGKLENLLYAQNILSNNILKTSLGAISRAVSIKKTGDFKYIKGIVTFSNGWANINSIQTSGPAMSMYITGKYNLLNNTVNVITLGRLSNDVVEVLGPIGNFSLNKLISSIPKIGTITANMINQMTTNPNNENLSMLPDLTPKQTGATKEFKVSIIGPVDSTSSIKYFKWLSTPQAAPQTPVTTTPQQTVEDVKNDVVETVKETPKNVINKYIPQIPTTTGGQSGSNQNKGLSDFLDSLPDLKVK